MPSDTFAVETVFVENAANGIEFGFAACCTGETPVGETG
jgi:hypothetical protein